MNVFNKLVAGQGIISWILQICLITLAWSVANHNIPNNTITITGAAILIILIYLSLAHDNKTKNNK